jgi:hypothetical protein
VELSKLFLFSIISSISQHFECERAVKPAAQSAEQIFAQLVALLGALRHLAESSSNVYQARNCETQLQSTLRQ